MSPLATVHDESLDNTTIVAVRGEIDVSNGDDIQAMILDSVTLTTRRLLLDLSDIAYFDSVGVRLAFDVEQRLARQSISFGIIRPPTSYVRKVLDLCGAEHLLPMYDDRALALDHRP